MRGLYLLRALTIAIPVFCAARLGAASIVIMAVDSGTTVPSSLGPPIYNGGSYPLANVQARGVLIGIDVRDGLGDVFTAVQELEFTGPIVQVLAPNAAMQSFLDDPPNVQTTSEGSLAQSAGDVPSPMHFRNEDSAWWDDTIPGVPGNGRWTPVATGIEDGEVGSNKMTLTAVLGGVGIDITPSEGVYPLIYVVITGDVQITGLIARTSNPDNATEIFSGIHFESLPPKVPEPSAIVLLGMGAAIGAAAYARRKGDPPVPFRTARER